MKSKPAAPISLDLDNKWSYLMVHAEPSWVDYPSYLPTLVPRVLDFLDERDLKITFFIVGKDATLPGHAELLAEIARRGHRIANHSHDHNASGVLRGAPARRRGHRGGDRSEDHRVPRPGLLPHERGHRRARRPQLRL
jgi:peptidoglycan/xylan/chitin deacetylase (PgdA/CDA1 family)